MELFSPQRAFIKKEFALFSPNILSNKKEPRETLKMPVKLLLFFLEVGQARLPKGRDLVSKLQFCDCSRYSDCVVREGQPMRRESLILSLVAFTQSTMLKKKATLKTQGKQVNPI